MQSLKDNLHVNFTFSPNDRRLSNGVIVSIKKKSNAFKDESQSQKEVERVNVSASIFQIENNKIKLVFKVCESSAINVNQQPYKRVLRLRPQFTDMKDLVALENASFMVCVKLASRNRQVEEFYSPKFKAKLMLLLKVRPNRSGISKRFKRSKRKIVPKKEDFKLVAKLLPYV